MVEAIRLQAADEDDLVVLSTLLQDATVLIGDMAHDPEQDRFDGGGTARCRRRRKPASPDRDQFQRCDTCPPQGLFA